MGTNGGGLARLRNVDVHEHDRCLDWLVLVAAPIPLLNSGGCSVRMGWLVLMLISRSRSSSPVGICVAGFAGEIFDEAERSLTRAPRLASLRLATSIKGG